jgi:L-alanine-DL-glutamate epimerase-like enolase superfamily enzyme
MSRPTDIRPVAARLYFLPIRTRVPLKFGPETLESVTLARASLTVEGRNGRRATGWGETPLSVQWVWPSSTPYEERHASLKQFTEILAHHWGSGRPADGAFGHPLEIGHSLIEHELHPLRDQFNTDHRPGREPMPYLASLVCDSVFDLALHDAFGMLHHRPTYDTYSRDWISRDLASFLEPAPDSRVSFADQFVSDYLVPFAPRTLVCWHLVGGKDPIEPSDLTGDEPNDGYPVLLRDWIQRDRLFALKVKLRGNDESWDNDRLRRVGTMAIAEGVQYLTFDFNGTVEHPSYVTEMLDRLKRDHPQIFNMVVYIEQPFPYDLEAHRIDCHDISARKPLFLDESAHDWRLVRLGRDLGWSGVALKTCKTQTGALLSLCWAKAHGMPPMVQDLTNPALAQVSHVQLAAHAGTIQGVESNAMQFYPEASAPEAAIHPGLYKRQNGRLDRSTLGWPGFGYRLDEMHRVLPPPAVEVSS